MFNVLCGVTYVSFAPAFILGLDEITSSQELLKIVNYFSGELCIENVEYVYRYFPKPRDDARGGGVLALRCRNPLDFEAKKVPN